MKGEFRLYLVRQALAAAVTGLAAVAAADTIHLQSGVAVDGVIVDRTDQRLTVRAGGRTVYLPSASVVKIDENERTGAPSPELVQQRIAEREQRLLEQTGLTREQRDEVKRLLAELALPDPAAQAAAREKLLAMANTVDLATYFDYAIAGMLPDYLPPVLEIMLELNPAAVVEPARQHAHNADMASRIKALEVLGRLNDRTSVQLIARGLVDTEPEVRAAAATALIPLDGKVATLVLIDNLNHPDLRVVNASRSALQRIWGQGALTSQADWQELWQKEGASRISNPIKTENLAPLVEPGAKVMVH